jgi:hypothetical protein
MKLKTIYFIIVLGLICGFISKPFSKKNQKNKNQSSFLQTNDDFDVNAAFDDDYAREDKFDNSIKVKKPYKDYNVETTYTSRDLMKRINDDLNGPKVNYQFD